MKSKTGAILLSAAIMVGCSSSSSDDSPEDIVSTPPTNGGADETSMPAPGATPIDTPLSTNRFDGNYLLACEPAPDEPDGEITRTIEVSIQGNTGSSTLTEYSDLQCTQPIVTFVVEVSFEYPGGTANTALGVADFINITRESATQNGENVPTDSEVFFDLILLDGNNLFFGLTTDELNGETADTRPVEIDQTNVFVRL